MDLKHFESIDSNKKEEPHLQDVETSRNQINKMMDALTYSQIEEIDASCGDGYTLLIEERLRKFFTMENCFGLPSLADEIYNMVRYLKKQSGKQLTITSFTYIWLTVKNEWVETKLNNFAIRSNWFFEDIVDLMKEYDYKMSILLQTTEFIAELSANIDYLIDFKIFHRASIIYDFIKGQFYVKIPIKDAAERLLFENKAGNEIKICRFVNFCKFIMEYDQLEFESSNRMESIIMEITKIFKSYFKSDIELIGKYDSIIMMWRNLTIFGAFLGPITKERLRILGFTEIYSDASIIVKLLQGLKISRDRYTQCHTFWEKAHQIKHKDMPVNSESSGSRFGDIDPLNDDFTRKFLTVNSIVFDPNNFEELYEHIKVLDNEQFELGTTYSERLLRQLRTNFLTSIGNSSLNQYYSAVVGVIMKAYENYKKKILCTEDNTSSKATDYSYLSYFVRYYCPNDELFLKKYWLPRLIKMISRPPENDPCAYHLIEFNQSLYYHMSKTEQDVKDEILKSLRDASDQTKTLENGCIFTSYLIPKAYVDIEVMDADTVWPDVILKNEWESVVGSLAESSKLLENNNAVHYVTIETPLKCLNGSPLLVQTSMCSASILTCFNDNDVMTLDNFIKELKVTKLQSKRLFSCLNKLLGSKLLLKTKIGMRFNYDFETSNTQINPMRI